MRAEQREIEHLQAQVKELLESVATVAKQRDREHERAELLLDAHRDVIGALRLLTSGADSNRYAIENDHYEKRVAEITKR